LNPRKSRARSIIANDLPPKLRTVLHSGLLSTNKRSGLERNSEMFADRIFEATCAKGVTWARVAFDLWPVSRVPRPSTWPFGAGDAQRILGLPWCMDPAIPAVLGAVVDSNARAEWERLHRRAMLGKAWARAARASFVSMAEA
jgi:hypothetical protein